MASSAPCDFRISITSGLASQTVLPISSSGRRPAAPVGVKEPARRVHRAIDFDAVLPRAHVVFLAVSGRRVYRAGALFERYVIRQNPSESRSRNGWRNTARSSLRAGERGHPRGSVQPHFLRRDLQQLRRHDVHRAATSAATYSNFGLKAMAMLAGMVHGVVVQISP